MDKLIITAAICGAEVSKEDNPNLPISAEELAEEAKKAEEAGASIIHVHVRDEDGNPTQSKEVFAKAIKAMEEKKCECNYTTFYRWSCWNELGRKNTTSLS